MNLTDRIVGSDKLTAVVGYWPSFHDAEVVWIKLDRNWDAAAYGPTLDALIHAFEATSAVTPDGCNVLRNHVLVHLRFRDVVELQLEDFNNQNVLFEISFSDVRELQLEYVEFEVEFRPSYGVGALFQCRAVEVVAVMPCGKNGEPIPA